MPDCGERPAEENERRLETALCRDPPPNNYGAQMLERSLPPQQQQQQQSGGRKKTGGITPRENYKGLPVEIRVPKWADSNKLWINSEDREAAKYNADAALYLTGQSPFHFPHAKFDYLPLRLSTGEELTTREKCSVYVAKIAKGSALRGQRKDFKKRAQKLILEMVKGPEAVQFLNIVRASPPPGTNPEHTYSPFTNDENGTAMEADTPKEAIQALASTVSVNSFQCGSLVPVVDTHSVMDDYGEEENGRPLEVDSLSEKAIRALAPTGTVDAAAVFEFDSTMTSCYTDVDMSTAFIPSFDMDLYEPENLLISAGQILGIWHPRFGEKEKEDLVPHNCKELLASLEKDEEEMWKSFELSDLEPWSPHPPFVPHSPLLMQATPPGSGWQSRRTTLGAGANEALRPPVTPILSKQMEALRHSVQRMELRTRSEYVHRMDEPTITNSRTKDG